MSDSLEDYYHKKGGKKEKIPWIILPYSQESGDDVGDSSLCFKDNRLMESLPQWS